MGQACSIPIGNVTFPVYAPQLLGFATGLSRRRLHAHEDIVLMPRCRSATLYFPNVDRLVGVYALLGLGLASLRYSSRTRCAIGIHEAFPGLDFHHCLCGVFTRVASFHARQLVTVWASTSTVREDV